MENTLSFVANLVTIISGITVIFAGIQFYREAMDIKSSREKHSKLDRLLILSALRKVVGSQGGFKFDRESEYASDLRDVENIYTIEQLEFLEDKLGLATAGNNHELNICYLMYLFKEYLEQNEEGFYDTSSFEEPISSIINNLVDNECPKLLALSNSNEMVEFCCLMYALQNFFEIGMFYEEERMNALGPCIKDLYNIYNKYYTRED